MLRIYHYLTCDFHQQQRTAWLEIADVYKKVALLTELLGSKSHNYKQLILLKMANRFIAYVPKLTKEKRSRPLCKSVPKEFGTFDNSQQTERNSMLTRAFAVESDLPVEKMNRDNGIMVGGTLPQHIL
jgi:hypothetical protein